MSSRRVLLGALALAIVAVAVVAAVFQPWRLVTDVEVADSDPFAAPPAPAAPAGVPPEPPSPTGSAPPASTTAAPVVHAAGSLASIAHPTTGTARLGTAADGSIQVFLDDLVTDNGPDLRVYLSRAPAGGDAARHGDDPLDLGVLKGNRGDQTYPVPEGIDLAPYRSVVIWCERFSVGFGVAPLDPV